VPAAALRAGPLAAVLTALSLAGCGGGSRAGSDAARSTASRPPKVTASVAPALRVTATTALPEAVQLPAVASGAGGVLALAGLDAADSSLARR
jgi:hypothetical protein